MLWSLQIFAQMHIQGDITSNSQAMVLPTVQNTADIPSPAPGMMVYVNRIGGKRLAVYNGSAWTYWKPQ